jgi:hypothetical protein
MLEREGIGVGEGTGRCGAEAKMTGGSGGQTCMGCEV